MAAAVDGRDSGGGGWKGGTVAAAWIRHHVEFVKCIAAQSRNPLRFTWFHHFQHLIYYPSVPSREDMRRRRRWRRWSRRLERERCGFLLVLVSIK